jgi:hypothetical protein
VHVLIPTKTSLSSGLKNLQILGKYLNCSHLREVLTAFRWLYSLILAEDANFKQKARARSNINKDPPLGPGWGTFVENEAYLRHISTAHNKTEVLLNTMFLLCLRVNS